MGFYSKYILPRAIDCACRTKPAMRQRAKVVPRAHGEVLEIGIGSGLNLSYYDASRVSKVWGLEPSAEMRELAAMAAAESDLEVEMIGLPGEEIPLGDDSVDTIVMTYTLCSIAETAPALQQMKRVLRPGGELLFSEHGASPDAGVRRWQDRLDPLWTRLAGGCHLNRDIPGLLRAGGFAMTDFNQGYIPGWRPACFNYWGAAVV